MIAVNITPLGLTVDGHAGYAFENDVKMYGTQTAGRGVEYKALFENDVKMYGTQTWLNRLMNMKMFENDVKMYGS